MRYTVTWQRSAEDELARIWLRAPDRAAVTRAADRIERLLANDPDRQGEEFYGDRLLTEVPLAVTFTVRADDRIVVIVAVQHQ